MFPCAIPDRPPVPPDMRILSPHPAIPDHIARARCAAKRRPSSAVESNAKPWLAHSALRPPEKIPPVPDGLENSIVEAEYHDVLHRLFSQIVIDAIDLIFLQHILDVAVQRLGRVQIVSKRLFDYHPAPASILLPRKRGCSQLLHNLRKKFGCGRQIEKIVALRMLLRG